MSKEYTSPEDRLLKLIKGDKKANNVAAPGEPAQKKMTIKIGAKKLNIILIVILVLLLAVLLIDSLRFRMSTRSHIRVEAPKAAENANSNRPATISQAIDTTDLESKDLFRAPSDPSQGVASGSSFDKLKDLTLNGIIAGDNPQAIIEDTKNKKSYFLNKGQSINRMTVKDILQDRVILEVDGETLELTL
ncbi:MAG: type II secretion system protein N [Candidatus Omnitrophota bacterium]